jgi:hypothetical protein
VAALTPEPLDVGGGETGDPDPAQGLLDLVEPVRLDDRDDQFHGACLPRRMGA